MAALLLASVISIGQATPPEKRVIQAEAFEVVDRSGNVMARLGMLGMGNGPPTSVELELFDRTRKGAKLMLNSGGVAIINEMGAVEVLLQNFLRDKEGCGLIVFDGAGKQRVRAVSKSDGSPEVWFGDKDGKATERLPK